MDSEVTHVLKIWCSYDKKRKFPRQKCPVGHLKTVCTGAVALAHWHWCAPPALPAGWRRPRTIPMESPSGQGCSAGWWAR